MFTRDEAFARARALQEAGQLEQAEQAFRLIIDSDPSHVEARYLLGAVYYLLRRPADAHAQLTEALRLRPDYAQAHNHLGVLQIEQGQLDLAIASFERAHQLDPSMPEAANNLHRAQSARHTIHGISLVDQGQLDEAAEAFRRAAELLPDSAEAHNNLGFALQARRKLPEALACFRRAIELAPDYALANVNVGVTLEKLGQAGEALPWLRRAVELAPENAEMHNNLGVALNSFGSRDQAMAAFEKALELNPDHPGARLNRALNLLARGDLERGFREFEWRRKQTGPSEPPIVEPRWSGEPLAGRTILLRGEEGFGDTIQMIRYAELVKERGGTVIAEVPSALASLAATCPGVDRAVASGQQLPHYDVIIHTLSLPLVLGTTLESIPARVPYLTPSQNLVEAWRQQLTGAGGSFKVGIAWQGNPNHKADRYRSIPLARFAPLADVPGVRLYSLQLGAGREQLADWPGSQSITDFGERLGDFNSTAALIKNFDLVISCDSAPAHLAGAIGMPVWLALAVTPDWRWLLDRSDSPWYPTMRLFRQHVSMEWPDVFQRIAQELAKKV